MPYSEVFPRRSTAYSLSHDTAHYHYVYTLATTILNIAYHTNGKLPMSAILLTPHECLHLHHVEINSLRDLLLLLGWIGDPRLHW
jgi:hypothetical protein